MVARATVYDDLPPASSTFKKGPDPVTVTGRPSELVLFFFGRAQLRDVAFDGDPDAVARLRGADLGI